MGSGYSIDSTLSTIEKKYKECPEETIAFAKECRDYIDKISQKAALELARTYAVYSPPLETEIELSFSLMDYNCNKIISLAEIDKYIVERYPRYDNKPALLRAYKAADSNGDGFIDYNEYRNLWRYIRDYTKYWYSFREMDLNGDRRLSYEEFLVTSKELFQLNLPKDIAKRTFIQMDKDGKGMVLFAEFCDYVIKHMILE